MLGVILEVHVSVTCFKGLFDRVKQKKIEKKLQFFYIGRSQILTLSLLHLVFLKVLTELCIYTKGKAHGSIQVFLRKVVRQSHTNVTSFCMQFGKIGRGLLRKAFWVLAKRERGK